MVKKVLIVDESERTREEILGLFNDGLYLKRIGEKLEYITSDNSGFLPLVNSGNGVLEGVSLCITDDINIVEYSRGRDIPTFFYSSGDSVAGKRAMDIHAEWIRKSFSMSSVYLIADSINVLFGIN